MSSSYRTFAYFGSDGEFVAGDDTSDLDGYLSIEAESLRHLADTMAAESPVPPFSEYCREMADAFDGLVQIKRDFGRHTNALYSCIAMLSRLLDDAVSEAAEPSKSSSSRLVDKVNEASTKLNDIAKRKTYQVTMFDEIVLNVWNLALERQRVGMIVSEDETTAGKKMLQNLEAARASREGPTLEQVERVLGRLRQFHPKLSETERRRLAAKELNCGLRTILRRLKKK
ncbi:MAG: hypothetical protein O3C40_27960 [Planctomycetota bacterium]|nr:hypothetical protein [Planctomycetota bacterium]